MIGCYIIYSKKIDKFYIGATQENITTRIEKHNNHSYGNHRYTAIANDWELFLFIECSSFSMATKIENHIKKMKSSTYIRNLYNYPEMINKLKLNFRN